MKAQNQKSCRFAGLAESELARPVQQYGCGPVRFAIVTRLVDARNDPRDQPEYHGA